MLQSRCASDFFYFAPDLVHLLVSCNSCVVLEAPRSLIRSPLRFPDLRKIVGPPPPSPKQRTGASPETGMAKASRKRNGRPEIGACLLLLDKLMLQCIMVHMPGGMPEENSFVVCLDGARISDIYIHLVFEGRHTQQGRQWHGGPRPECMQRSSAEHGKVQPQVTSQIVAGTACPKIIASQLPMFQE